jgi:hypothetical protein
MARPRPRSAAAGGGRVLAIFTGAPDTDAVAELLDRWIAH